MSLSHYPIPEPENTTASTLAHSCFDHSRQTPHGWPLLVVFAQKVDKNENKNAAEKKINIGQAHLCNICFYYGLCIYIHIICIVFFIFILFLLPKYS